MKITDVVLMDVEKQMTLIRAIRKLVEASDLPHESKVAVLQSQVGRAIADMPDEKDRNHALMAGQVAVPLAVDMWLAVRASGAERRKSAH